MKLSESQLLDFYRQMLLVRRMEERIAQEYRNGNIPGFVHLYIGEEAVAVGICAHLKKADYVTSTHRGHGHALAKGIPPKKLMAELYGRSTGCSGGRGGSMHLFDKDCGFLGSNGLVGPSIVNAAGAAFSANYFGSGNIAVGFFGDGAVNTGSFHEGLNLAAIWSLPVVFVCENNMYATEMPFEQATAGNSVAGRASAYGIPGVEVDGQDVVAVFEAAGEAVARAREGNGPTLLECKTYRFVGHHEGDPGTDYRTDAEVQAWKARDPLQLLREKPPVDTVSEEVFDEIEREIAGIVDEAAEFAANSPEPDVDDLETHVFLNREASPDSGMGRP